MSQSKTNREEIKAKVMKIINGLPHREAIAEGDIQFWVDHVVGEHGSLAVWHAVRAGGFGGSQIGALVRNFMGQRADHEASAHDIVKGALLRSVPEEPTGHMRRGIAMESEHREWFYRKYSAVRNAVAFEKLSKGVGSRPWMRYSPDELADMIDPSGMTNANQLWLGDYKAPSQIDESSKVAFQYVCQLHMGRMVCESNGVKVDGMILSQFDWRNWSLKDDIIQYNPDLDPLIISAGDHYWDYVQRGQVPPYVRKERLDDPDGVAKKIKDRAQRISRLKALGKIFGDKADELQKELVEELGTMRFGNSKLVIANALSISASDVFDEELVTKNVPEAILAAVPLKKASSNALNVEKLEARVRETLRPGEKFSSFYAPGKMDTDALYAAISEAGLDPDTLVTERLRVALSPIVVKDAQTFLEREFPDLLAKPEAPAAVIEEAYVGDVHHA